MIHFFKRRFDKYLFGVKEGRLFILKIRKCNIGSEKLHGIRISE